MAHPHHYTVIDLETTGLFPNGSDRVIEVALLRLDERGEVIDRYATLVNPDRDVGATHVHGVTAGDVRGAPPFAEIAGDVFSRFADAYLVAHNASFDRRFLYAEAARVGIDLPEIPTLCTMMLAGRAQGRLPSRKLEAICAGLGIEIQRAHTAEDDATATATLFRTCVDQLGGWSAVDFTGLCMRPAGRTLSPWPALACSGRSYRRSDAARSVRDHESFIPRLLARLPVSAPPASETSEYMALLDRVLEDRRITPEEIHELLELAREIGLDQTQTMTVHRQYFTDLLMVALADEVITPAEQRDLDLVCRLLGLDETAVAAAHGEAARRLREGALPCGPPALPSQELAGLKVCFTGSLGCNVDGARATKELAKAYARERGMVVQTGVTKKTDLLVAADPDSLSGKAKKARAYGVRIVAEPAFWRMMGVQAG